MPTHSLSCRSRAAALAAFCLAAAATFAAVESSDVRRRLEQQSPAHPRLFLAAGGEAELRARIATDPMSAKLHAGLLREAERLLTTKPVERVLIGRRLLDQSRTCLSRVLHLGLAWRFTGDKKYLERAQRELLAPAAFSDWNPQHFLDAAAMTTAVAIGYDWFYPALDEPARRALREAIVEKGLEPASAKLKIFPTDPPPAATDARNEGTRLLGFEVRVPAGQPQRVVVHLAPDGTSPTAVVIEPLATW